MSGAKSPDYLLSATQMVEIAKFIGMPEAKAKTAISGLGDYIDS